MVLCMTLNKLLLTILVESTVLSPASTICIVYFQNLCIMFNFGVEIF